jgi:hypothetical protein
MATPGEKGLQPRGRLGNGVRRGDPAEVEAKPGGFRAQKDQKSTSA